MGKAILPSVAHCPGHQLLPIFLPPPATPAPRHMHGDLLGDSDFICPQKTEKKEQKYFCDCVALGVFELPMVSVPSSVEWGCTAVVYVPAARLKRSRACKGAVTMKHVTHGSRHLGLESSIATTIQSASFVSKPGRTSEGEGGPRPVA